MAKNFYRLYHNAINREHTLRNQIEDLKYTVSLYIVVVIVLMLAVMVALAHGWLFQWPQK